MDTLEKGLVPAVPIARNQLEALLCNRINPERTGRRHVGTEGCSQSDRESPFLIPGLDLGTPR